jgi:hypothetical protein
MRAVSVGVCLSAILVLAAGCDQSSDGEDKAAGKAAEAAQTPRPPQRALGQWEHKVTVFNETRTMKICLDAAAEQRLAWWSQNPQECSQQEVNKQADGSWIFYSVFRTQAGGETTSSGAVTGDFAKAYTVLSTTSTQGATDPRANMVLDMKVEAKFLGPCPGGQRGGDRVAPDGKIDNLLEQKP